MTLSKYLGDIKQLLLLVLFCLSSFNCSSTIDFKIQFRFCNSGHKTFHSKVPCHVSSVLVWSSLRFPIPVLFSSLGTDTSFCLEAPTSLCNELVLQSLVRAPTTLGTFSSLLSSLPFVYLNVFPDLFVPLLHI